MPTARLTSKGQITVPRDVRKALGLRTGDRLAFRVLKDGSVLVEAESVDLLSLAGALKTPVKGVSVTDMQRAIQRGATARTRRR